MASHLEFRNANVITDNDDIDDDRTKSIPKKNLKAAFELVHPVIEEEKLKELEEHNKKTQAIQKIEEDRFKKYKYAFYGVSILSLIFFSLKNWFPLIKNPFF